ncbi:hypothetical protein ACFS5L_28380 [Streptomyces phyllanthi]|uniref:Helix-turn-helix domain-containing protein n=1 Tax=Streptomyces phyllanthi TaxID=1803180 RepID=A0A5N8W6Y0_9ACTN|nr:hypothetical protein [Streptomyces phyllanthi]MPY42128.1 hypothetical protein [Streptomyces phyllanthi]
MRIHRTTPKRAFSVFSNALLRDRSISWCAVGVLTYLLSLPNGARVTIRTLAEQRKEGRARIAAALHELEESRYLRRVVRKSRETGQLFTVYEVFDAPYEDEPPAGEDEKVQNLASGESDVAPSGPPPSGEKTREKEPPSPPPQCEPQAPREPKAPPAPPAPSGPSGSTEPPPPAERTALAAQLLGSLGRTDPRLTLGAAEALRLAPLVEEWWELGATSAQVRAALTGGLPRPLYSARALVEDRLRRKRPAAPATAPVTTVEVECRKPGASAYREAAQRGGALARALLRGRAVPA